MGPEQLLAAALHGESAPWPPESTVSLETTILDAAADHGVSGMLSAMPAVSGWPLSVRTALAATLRAEAALEVFRRDALITVLNELAGAGVRALVLKGAHLAYTHYARPWLRPRLDSDVLVAPSDRARADDVLRALGYRPGNHYNGSLVTHQFRYERRGAHGVIDVVDLHWQVFNPHLFATVFTYDELEIGATSIEPLGPHARGPADVQALILACIHRVAHHDNSDRLIWLHDIHLLARSLTPDAGEAVVQLATVKRLRAVCATGCRRAHARFATTSPQEWLRRLENPSDEAEASAAFLKTRRNKVDMLISDLRMLDGSSRRARLIWEHVFPPPAYIRQAYGLGSPLLVPLCYAHRVAFGMSRWFSRRHEGL